MSRFAKVYLEISNLCNLTCAFCPGTKRKPHAMTEEEFSSLLPKLRPNRYVGIRLPWIMHDEDRWSRTHRFGGYVLVVCGALMLTLSVFPGIPRWTALALLASAVGIIIIYSWKVK